MALLNNGRKMNHRPINNQSEHVEESSQINTDEVKKLDTTVAVSEEPLMTVETVFPFDFFQDKVMVDTTKITIIRKKFFAMYQVESFLIRDLVTVVLETSLFFASIKFVDRFFAKDPAHVHHLHKSEAEKLRRIIHGLMIAKNENIEVNKVPVESLSNKLEQLGSATNSRESEIAI